MAGVYTRYIYHLSGLFGYTYTSVLRVLAYIHIKVLAGGLSGIDSSVYIIITYYNYIIVIYNIIVINNNNIIIIQLCLHLNVLSTVHIHIQYIKHVVYSEHMLMYKLGYYQVCIQGD